MSHQAASHLVGLLVPQELCRFRSDAGIVKIDCILSPAPLLVHRLLRFSGKVGALFCNEVDAKRIEGLSEKSLP